MHPQRFGRNAVTPGTGHDICRRATMERLQLQSPGQRPGGPKSDFLSVRKAYKREWNREESRQSGSFVVGSIYGGLLFDFQDGKVSQIFLGVAAE